MAMKKGGLGRGLDALLSDNTIQTESSLAPVLVNIMDVEPNKEQARKHFDEDALAELSKSIQEHGVLQPLLVRPIMGGAYQLVAGERRWRASRLAGLEKVPVIVKELSDDEAAVISLIENLQREDLNPVEEALGYKALIDEFGLTHEQVADKVNKSRASVTNALRIINLPAEALEYLRCGKITMGHAKAILGLKDEAAINEVAKLIVAGDWSVRQTENYVKKVNKTPAPAKEPKVKRRNPVFDEVELALSNECGLKAVVEENRKGDAGVLKIEFYSVDHLKEIVKKL